MAKQEDKKQNEQTNRGLAIDVHSDGKPVLDETFEESEEFDWLAKNAVRYGFRLSYPRSNNLGIIYEPWHWSFVGEGVI